MNSTLRQAERLRDFFLSCSQRKSRPLLTHKTIGIHQRSTGCGQAESLLPVAGALVGPRGALSRNSHSHDVDVARWTRCSAIFTVTRPRNTDVQQALGGLGLQGSGHTPSAWWGDHPMGRSQTRLALHSRWKTGKLCATTRVMVSARCKPEPA